MISSLRASNGGGTCNGGDPRQALEYISSHGVPDETCTAYTASNGDCASPAGLCETCVHGSGDQPFLPGVCKAVPNPELYTVAQYGDGACGGGQSFIFRF